MRARTLGGLLLFVGGIGCGGGSSSGPLTRTLVSNVPERVEAGDCIPVEGPYAVGTGRMAFTIQDTPTGIGDDTIEVGIIPDVVQACDFSQATVSESFTGTFGDEGTAHAGTYDFVVACHNIVDPCLFNLTWTATY